MQRCRMRVEVESTTSRWLGNTETLGALSTNVRYLTNIYIYIYIYIYTVLTI